MSASNCPETPRQKMIQMMYLVYTAMLALNVAAEVVNGFVTVGDAMNKSNENVELKIQYSYDQFAKAHENNPEKTQEFYDKALEVKQLANGIKNYIDSLQCEFLCTIQKEAKIVDHEKNKTTSIPLQDKSGNLLIDSARAAFQRGGLAVIEKKDDNHSGSAYFYGTKDKASGKCIDLRDRIIQYKKELKRLMGADSSSLQVGLDVETPQWSSHEKKMVPWEQFNFDNTITIADMVVLSRLKAEAMNAEFDAVNILFNQVSMGDFKFDQVTAISRPSATYIIQGGKYETKINIGAYDSKAKTEAVINGQRLTSDETGSITYTAACTAPGEKKVKGVVYVKKDSGVEEYPIEDTYFVAEPMGSVEMTKMNVAYAGIDNPVNVSVPGVDSRNVVVSIPGGGATITKDPQGNAGAYIIRAQKIGKVKVQVDAKLDGKTLKTMVSKEIRIKMIPTPELKVGNFKNNDIVSKNEILVDPTLRAKCPDFDFQLPPLKITSFSFNVSGSQASDIQGNGNKLTPDMIDRIKNARRGQKIYIDDVVVKTPDGRTHTLAATFKIKG